MNNLVKARFALYAMRLCAESADGELLKNCLTTLRASNLQRAVVGMSGCKAFDAEMAVDFVRLCPHRSSISRTLATAGPIREVPMRS